jgi:hypothetical protein
MDDHAKDIDRVWKALHAALLGVFDGKAWRPFQLSDGYHEFHARSDLLRQAVGLARGCRLTRAFVLEVDGSSEEARSSLSHHLARLVALQAIKGGDGLSKIVLAELDSPSHPLGLTCKDLFGILLSRAEGDQPLFELLETLGDGLSTMSLTPDVCSRVWGPAVRERAYELATAIAAALEEHRTPCQRAFREYYAPEAGLSTIATRVLTFDEEFNLWLQEEPDRKEYPTAMPVFAMKEYDSDEARQEDHAAYWRQVEQHREYLRVRLQIAQCLEAKEEDDDDEVAGYVDEHTQLQQVDAVRQLVGGGLAEYVQLEGAHYHFTPKNPAALTEKGWRVAFLACTPERYHRLFTNRTFTSLRGWTDVLDGALRLEASTQRTRARAKTSATPVPSYHPPPSQKGTVDRTM